jgi:2'-5' RNA ligase
LTQPEPVVGRSCETALSVVVPEADAPTLDFRRRFLERTVSRKIPAHVTILYPFVTADAVDAQLLAELHRLYASAAPFAFRLANLGTFDAHLWLAPEPRERFVDLMELTFARFPECPPYGGAFAKSAPEPHLTIGEGVDVDALRVEADRTVVPALPLPCTAGSVTLLEERTDGTWSERAAFPLGGR